MNKNEIKKLLYKEKPMAQFMESVNGFQWYTADLSVGTVAFKIPTEEAGTFSGQEPAQLLIRWLQEGMAVPRMTTKD